MATPSRMKNSFARYVRRLNAEHVTGSFFLYITMCGSPYTVTVCRTTLAISGCNKSVHTSVFVNVKVTTKQYFFGKKEMNINNYELN